MLDPDELPWDRYPAVGKDPLARKWLETQVLLGLAANTIDAYARALQDFLAYCQRNAIQAQQATRDEIARYIGDLRRRPSARGPNIRHIDSGVGLSNATLQQKLTAVGFDTQQRKACTSYTLAVLFFLAGALIMILFGLADSPDSSTAPSVRRSRSLPVVAVSGSR